MLAALYVDFWQILIKVAGLFMFADFELPILHASLLLKTVILSALHYLLICLLMLIAGFLPEVAFLPPF